MSQTNRIQEYGTIFDIQRFSVHDGPGIRTLVFLKGCSLRCRWCSNPEGLRKAPQQFYVKSNCHFCGMCVAACPKGAAILNENGRLVNALRCTMCGKCAEACVYSALRIVGWRSNVTELVEELRKDADHYTISGGGITLSGGEALLQPAFCAALLQACHAEGWNTAVETTANVPWQSLEMALPYLDHVLLDIKHANSRKHRQFTSVPNERILTNAKRLAAFPNIDLTIRIPLIPGFNDTDEEIRQIARIVASLQKVSALRLLPFHRMGENKYEYLGLEYSMAGQTPQHSEHITSLRNVAAAEVDIPCLIGG